MVYWFGVGCHFLATFEDISLIDTIAIWMALTFSTSLSSYSLRAQCDIPRATPAKTIRPRNINWQDLKYTSCDSHLLQLKHLTSQGNGSRLICCRRLWKSNFKVDFYPPSLFQWTEIIILCMIRFNNIYIDAKH